ncbi:MAG TPA: AAA family ATPase [Stellaceae bacterium]|nr:AAA family ATPase [Stellaceae bacterium]
MAKAIKIASDKGSTPQPHLIALLADDATREAASEAAEQLGWADAVIRAGGIAKAAHAIEPPPAVLLVDISDDDDPDALVGELVKRCGSATRIVAVGTVNDVTLFRRLAARGVVDYLVKPVSSALLTDALRRAGRGESEATDPGRQARIHAFIGARGGVGASTLVLGVAWLLAQEHKLRTALVDLDLHFGTLALSLDLEPGRGLRQALEHPERTDGLLLASAMVKGDEQLPILGAEESLEDVLHFEPDGAEALLTALAQDYDCLLIDLPRSLDGAARHVLASADNTFIVTDFSLAALRDAFRLSSLVKSLGAAGGPLVVASQVGALHRGEIGRAEFERGLGTSVDFAVPFDPKAARAMAVGGKTLPAVDGASKAAAEMRRIAARIAGREVKAKTGLKRWFG